MSFQLKKHSNGTTGLVATCDVCGKEVQADEANILWQPEATPGPKFITFAVACNEKCTPQLDQKMGEHFWQGLDVGLGYLLNNTRWNRKEAITQMEGLASIAP